MKHSPSFVRIMSKMCKSRSVHELKKKIGIFHGSVSFGFRDILKFVVVVVVLL